MKNLLSKINKVQQEVGKLSKDSKNPFFKSSYLSLNELIDNLQPLLNQYDLCVIHQTNNWVLTTKVFDLESGENIESSTPIPQLNDSQKIGSALTYNRRYNLVNLFNIQAVDDDANLASGKSTTKETKPQPEKWFNQTDLDKVVKRIQEGKSVTLQQITDNYKVSKEMRQQLINLNIQ